ncbi:MAG TPA: cobyric acid synthase [Victivallales bacterium]|nr:cobyric acid synthase [Victivallales bacterium]
MEIKIGFLSFTNTKLRLYLRDWIEKISKADCKLIGMEKKHISKQNPANFADHHGGDASSSASLLGLKKLPEEIIDFSVNVNPYGPPQAVKDLLSSLDYEQINSYPDSCSSNAIKALAKAHGHSSENILVGNGSTELFAATLSALSPEKVVLAAPCYSGYEEVCRSLGIQCEYFISAKPETNFRFESEKLHLKSGDFLFICNPNNPSGAKIANSKIISIAEKFKGSWIGIDESFIDYDNDSLFNKKQSIPGNILVFKSLTKFFGIAGLRLGMMFAPRTVSKKIRAKLLPWNVNSIAQNTAPLLYSDKNYLCETRKKNENERNFLLQALSSVPIKVFPSSTNFLLCEIRSEKNNIKFLRFLLEKGFLLRDCSRIRGLGENFVRIAVLDRKSNERLVDEIKNYFNAGKKKIQKKPAKSLMIVGTSSDSGKSLVTAALCGILSQKGVRIAPFKAQNMALNSFVTKSGGEIGRAQAFQAKCAGIEAENDMNPVLLKPSGDARCQVIVNGKVYKTLSAADYYKINDYVREKAFEAYDRLSAKYDFIVMEGAGSPAEINLLHRDFVNMAMAEYAGADVILVADIDRGGVFASIYGTMRLLPERWRKLFKGIIINKFRGDETLLKSGIERIEALTGVKVLGVLPYVKNLKIEEEDSLALDNRKESKATKKDITEIVVIRYPRISNYTDFLVFEKRSDCNLRYVDKADEIGSPDIIFLPGSKNTRADLEFLKKTGIADRILEYHSKGGPVFGICGGYQILGRKISDPYGSEDKAGKSSGLSLIKMDTVLRKKKQVSQVSGKIIAELPFADMNTEFKGYEIHMGESKGSSEQILEIYDRRDEKNISASISDDGLVFGTYIHGFFDEKKIADGLINWLRKRKGATPLISKDDDDSFDKFCELFEKKIKYRGL